MGDFKDKTGKTRVGKALSTLGKVADPLLSILGDTNLPGSEIFSKLSDAIVTSEEIEEHKKIELLNLLTLDLQDIANARTQNIEIQKSQFSSWWAKNLPYLMDAFFVLIWGALTIYIIGVALKLVHNDSADFNVVLGIYAAVCSKATMVLQFHRGSSQGSKLKDLLKNE